MLADRIERVRCRHWHGQLLDLIGAMFCEVEANDEKAGPAKASLRKLTVCLGELETYVSIQSASIIN